MQPAKRPSTKDLLEMPEMKLHRKLFTVQNQYVYNKPLAPVLIDH